LFTLPAGDHFVSITADNEDSNVLLDGLTTTVTPEPNSLLLLGTGIIAAAGALRKKLAAYIFVPIFEPPKTGSLTRCLRTREGISLYELLPGPKEQLGNAAAS
jgi:hypothetical protein